MEKEHKQKKKVTALNYLKDKIKKLIQDIDYRQISRECNLQFLNSEIFQKSDQSIQVEIVEDEELTGKAWQSYYEYLLFVYENVRKIRRKFNFRLDKNLNVSEGLKVNRLVNGHKKRFHNRKSMKMMEKLKINNPEGMEDLEDDKEVSSNDEFEEDVNRAASFMKVESNRHSLVDIPKD